MAVGTLVAQAVGHLVEQYDAHASRRPLVGGDGEVCGRVVGGVEGLAVVGDGDRQLTVSYGCLEGDGGGLAVVDDIGHGLLDGQTQTSRLLAGDACLGGRLFHEGFQTAYVVHRCPQRQHLALPFGIVGGTGVRGYGGARKD